MKFKLLLITSAVFVFYLNSSFAQTQQELKDALNQANELYKNGTVDEIPQILDKYINSGFSRKQNKEALKLVVLAYLFDDNQQEARGAMHELLKSFPEFKAEPNDPVELVYLLESFEKKISFSIGVSGGLNYNMPDITKSYSNVVSLPDKSVNPAIGNQFGVQLNKAVYKGLDVRLDVNYSNSKYQFEQPTSVTNENTVCDEIYSSLSVPVWLVYNFNIKNNRFYVKAGGGINSTVESSVQLDLGGTNTTYNVTSHRNAMNIFAGGGAGFCIKIPTGFINIDCSYINGLDNLVNETKRYSVPDMQDLYYYVEDDFKLNNITFTIGYSFLFYKILDK